MINSHWLLILLYIGGLIPMNTYLMKGYMDSIPMDLDESAKIDGASKDKNLLPDHSAIIKTDGGSGRYERLYRPARRFCAVLNDIENA